MFVSVILSTYESPEWLKKVIWGYAAQTHRQFEIVIADDGSSESTAQCIERMREATQLHLRHVWQPNRGFGKCRILNRAIRSTAGDYVVFSDGDCIPRNDFLAQHVKFAAPGYFLSGGIVRLPRDLSEQLTSDDIFSGRAMRMGWLTARSSLPKRKLLLLLGSGRWAPVFDRLTSTRATFNGHNSSAWKRDLMRVNGFDERLGYGGLDRELGERLVNSGVRARQIRHRAVCVHLDHARGYVDPKVVANNHQIREENERNQAQWTAYGIYPGAGQLRLATGEAPAHHDAAAADLRIRHAA